MKVGSFLRLESRCDNKQLVHSGIYGKMSLYIIIHKTKSLNMVALTKRWKSTIRKIDKLLVANRGEIACRIMRTAKRMGIQTVAVYSEADEKSLHVQMADEAYKIGPAPATQSYLRSEKLLEIAQISHSQAIHPGYGFLSENAAFSEECQKSGFIFIGPPASAIKSMGIKSTSKEIMSEAGVPVIQGYHGQDQSLPTLKSQALKIGFPIMIKAVLGGGGKGMRIALNELEFEEALESAKTEAQKAFGDSVVLLEKFVAEPRHVEVQVFADFHGNAVHLFERDCSVQRRHQKIIEEAPAPGLSDSLRAELGAAAVRAAAAVGYVGAGTVEFILDRKNHSFHFMEMNTRLQVEHPITEMITGLDLVEWQIKVAEGRKLPLNQREILHKGHSFEARIYAENPEDGFLPGAGKILHLSTPSLDSSIRIESGVREKDEVSVHYDPMIAKLVVWAENRDSALSKLHTSLHQYQIAGLETNVNFLLDLAKHPEFIAGNVHTNFIKDHHASLFQSKPVTGIQLIQAVLAQILGEQLDNSTALQKGEQYNPFVVESGFRINHKLEREIKLKRKETDYLIRVKYIGKGHFEISTDQGQSWDTVLGQLRKEDTKLVLESTRNGVKNRANIYFNNEIIAIFDQNGKTEFTLERPSFDLETDEERSSAVSDKAVAPMPGIIDKILITVGDEVKKGDSLFVLIAMKMEHVVKASRDARISDILVNVGGNVQKDSAVVIFEKHISES